MHLLVDFDNVHMVNYHTVDASLRERRYPRVKKAYWRPQVVEYGPVEQLTLGQSGSSPDFVALGSILVPIDNNTDCNPTIPHPGLVCS